MAKHKKKFYQLIKKYNYNLTTLVEELNEQGYIKGDLKSNICYAGSMITGKKPVYKEFIQGVEALCENDPEIREYFSRIAKKYK
ncbi:MAG: hypothetical protein ACP5N3_00325 [Candidatus Nanoarchaeia archaeon]